MQSVNCVYGSNCYLFW